jgi:hypothetical protein
LNQARIYKITSIILAISLIGFMVHGNSLHKQNKLILSMKVNGRIKQIGKNLRALNGMQVFAQLTIRREPFDLISLLAVLYLL